MMKRLIAIISAMVLMVTCASCGGGAATSDAVSDGVVDGVRTICAACERELDGSFAFCPYCGAAEAQTVCTSCNQEIAGNFAFCPNCGASTGSVTTDEGSSDTDTSTTTAGGSSDKGTATTKKANSSNKGGSTNKNTVSTNKNTAPTNKNTASTNKNTASTNKGNSSNKVNSTVSSAAGNNSSSSNSSNGGSSGGNGAGSTPLPTYNSSYNVSQEINSDGLKYSDNVESFKDIPAELKGKTVIFSDFGEAVADEYQKVIEKFTKDTGINVKMIVFLKSEYINKVALQIAAGKAPDIAVCADTFPAALEIVQPLPSYFDVNDGFWDKRVSEATKIKGKYYFVNTINSPFTGGYAVYYNKKHFYSAGLKTPQDYYDEGNWTYETFKRAAKECTLAGYKGAIFNPLVLARQMGGDLLRYNPGTASFSSTATDVPVVKAFQYHADGITEGAFCSGSVSQFAQGGIGLVVADTGGLKYDGYFKDLLPSDIGAMPLPASFDGKQLNAMPVNYRGYGICKGAYNIDEAYYLLRYFLDLDKYEPAGAYIFASKSLERYFRATHLVQYQNSPTYFSYTDSVLSWIGKGWDSGAWDCVKQCPAGQVTVELAKMKDTLNKAAAWANQRIDDYT